MADDWTPMRNNLHDDPAVVTMAMLLKIEADTVVGKLLRVWSWAGSHTVTGACAGVTQRHVDNTARIEGFADAMVSAGWLRVTEVGDVVFPKWTKRNGKAAKKRLQDALRSSRYRRKTVTQPSRKGVTKSAPTEEKRREESNTPLKPPQGGGMVGSSKRTRPLTLEQVKAATAAEYERLEARDKARNRTPKRDDQVSVPGQQVER